VIAKDNAAIEDRAKHIEMLSRVVALQSALAMRGKDLALAEFSASMRRWLKRPPVRVFCQWKLWDSLEHFAMTGNLVWTRGASTTPLVFAVFAALWPGVISDDTFHDTNTCMTIDAELVEKFSRNTAAPTMRVVDKASWPACQPLVDAMLQRCIYDGEVVWLMGGNNAAMLIAAIVARKFRCEPLPPDVAAFAGQMPFQVYPALLDGHRSTRSFHKRGVLLLTDVASGRSSYVVVLRAPCKLLPRQRDVAQLVACGIVAITEHLVATRRARDAGDECKSNVPADFDFATITADVKNLVNAELNPCIALLSAVKAGRALTASQLRLLDRQLSLASAIANNEPHAMFAGVEYTDTMKLNASAWIAVSRRQRGEKNSLSDVKWLVKLQIFRAIIASAALPRTDAQMATVQLASAASAALPRSDAQLAGARASIALASAASAALPRTDAQLNAYQTIPDAVRRANLVKSRAQIHEQNSRKRVLTLNRVQSVPVEFFDAQVQKWEDVRGAEDLHTHYKCACGSPFSSLRLEQRVRRKLLPQGDMRALLCPVGQNAYGCRQRRVRPVRDAIPRAQCSAIREPDARQEGDENDRCRCEILVARRRREDEPGVAGMGGTPSASHLSSGLGVRLVRVCARRGAGGVAAQHRVERFERPRLRFVPRAILEEAQGAHGYATAARRHWPAGHAVGARAVAAGFAQSREASQGR
jgi:hypothetical protein